MKFFLSLIISSILSIQAFAEDRRLHRLGGGICNFITKLSDTTSAEERKRAEEELKKIPGLYDLVISEQQKGTGQQELQNRCREAANAVLRLGQSASKAMINDKIIGVSATMSLDGGPRVPEPVIPTLRSFCTDDEIDWLKNCSAPGTANDTVEKGFLSFLAEFLSFKGGGSSNASTALTSNQSRCDCFLQDIRANQPQFSLMGRSGSRDNSRLGMNLQLTPPTALASGGSASGTDSLDLKFDSAQLAVAEETVKLRKRAVEEFGKKFIENYSKQLEHGIFFTGIRRLSDSRVQQVECADPTLYNAKIDSHCKNTKQSEETKAERIKMLLNAMGKDYQGDLKQMMGQLNQDILVLPAIAGVRPKAVDRKSFNIARHAWSKEDENINLADNAMAQIFKNTKFLNQVKELQRSNPRLSPMNAVAEFLAQEAANKDSEFWKVLSRNLSPKVSKETRESIEKNLGAGRKEDMVPIITKNFLIPAVGAHPGFSVAMEDWGFFDELSKKSATSTGNSIFEVMENDSDLITNHFSQKCQRMVEDFAKAVCTPEREILSSMPADDLEKFMKRELGSDWLLSQKSDIYKYILCTNFDDAQDGFLTGIHDDRSNIFRSDYVLRATNDNSTDSFSVFAKTFSNTKEGTASEGFSDIQQRLLTAVQNTSHTRSSAPSSRSALNNIPLTSGDSGELFSFDKMISEVTGKSSEANVVEKVATAQTTVVSSKVDGATDYAQSADSYNQNMYGHQTGQLTGPVNPVTTQSQTSRQVKEDNIADFLSDKAKRKEVKEQLADLEDKQLDELRRLREGGFKAQEQLLEDEIKRQEQQLSHLRSKLDGLMDKKAKSTKAIAQSENEAENEDDTDSNKRDTRRKPASIQSNLGNVSNASFMGPANGATGSETFSASGQGEVRSATLGSGQATAAMARSDRGISPVLSGPRGQDSGSAIIISSDKMIASGDLQAKDLNSEVINFLEKAPIDEKVLEQIKSRGMIYKYKVQEEGRVVEKEVLIRYDTLSPEARKVIEARLGQNTLEEEIREVRRQHSYLSLKLLISQQIRDKGPGN